MWLLVVGSDLHVLVGFKKSEEAYFRAFLKSFDDVTVAKIVRSIDNV